MLDRETNVRSIYFTQPFVGEASAATLPLLDRSLYLGHKADWTAADTVQYLSDNRFNFLILRETKLNLIFPHRFAMSRTSLNV